MSFYQLYKPQIDWLLQSDPAIRYQTLRDLKDHAAVSLENERNAILQRGWGFQLMGYQDAEGTWSNALYSKKWVSTFYTLLLLKRFEAPVDERLQRAATILLQQGFYEPDGGINYWKTWRQGECCVTGMLLSMLCFFQVEDERIELMLDYLMNQQMADGGWNCEKYRGAHHSSFHTTISVLEGLAEYRKYYPRAANIESVHSVEQNAIEFLLQHHLYKSNTTWQSVHPDMTKLSFPPRWHYDILRVLDYWQANSKPHDERMCDAIDLLKHKQTKDGFWKREKKYPGKVFFELEKGPGPSRWNTLRALRVLRWWGI